MKDTPSTNMGEGAMMDAKRLREQIAKARYRNHPTLSHMANNIKEHEHPYWGEKK